MDILIIENSTQKFNLIHAELKQILQANSCHISRAKTTAEATQQIYQKKFDLIIIDLMMPNRPDDIDQDISEEIINIIEDSGLNTTTHAIALSAFQEIIEQASQRFGQAGIFFVHFRDQDDSWKTNLSTIVEKIHSEEGFDFVIICALEKERQALHQTIAKIGETENIRGLDCMHVEIGQHKGLCIKPPRMGLVEASVITARAIERFRIRAVTMSGICAGVEGKSKPGQLVIADSCWEYQSGKLTDEGFDSEPYSISLRPKIRTFLSQYSNSDDCLEELCEGLGNDDLHGQDILIAPMSSGSAVIASEEKMQSISQQHRKMAALEMEMYGVYKAAELSGQEPIFFGAKTVVDLGDKDKSNSYQAFGAALSARFIVKSLNEILSDG